MEIEKLKGQIIVTGRKMLMDQMVVGTWGNISCKTEQQVIITPSGVDYLQLTQEDLPVVSVTGEKLAGRLKPSSELPLHLAIYKKRDDVKAIIHTHSTYGTCCAVLHQAIPPLIEDMAMVIGGSVAVADYYLPGTNELAEAVVKALGQKNSVLLANHGVVSVGTNLEEALKAALLTEKAAKIFLVAKSIGDPVVLSDEDVALMRENYLYNYGQKGGKENENPN